MKKKERSPITSEIIRIRKCDSCYQVFLSPHAILTNHSHNYEEINMVHKGRFEIVIDHIPYVLGPGESITIRANKLHVVRNLDSSESILLAAPLPNYNNLI